MAPLRLGVCLGLLMPLAGCGGKNLSFLDPQGPVAAQQRGHFLLIVALVLIVVLPVITLLPLLLWRYRYGRNARYAPYWSFSKPIEVVIWGVPVLIVAALMVFLWRNTTDLDPWTPLSTGEPPLRVQVIGYDWKWLFVYPGQDIATVNELIFPAGQQLAFELTSETVMQSFFIPALGSQVYAMGGGMVTQLHLAAFAPGEFYGVNTQYNGNGFQQQHFQATALSPDAFRRWVADVKENGVAWTGETQTTLSRRSTPRETAGALGAGGGDTIELRGVPDHYFETVVSRQKMSSAALGTGGDQ